MNKKTAPEGAVPIGRFVGEQSIQTSGRLDVADGDLAGAAIFLGIERNLLAFDQPAHSGALKSRSVDEDVLAAVVRLNEAEAFLVVVELHGARIHQDILSLSQVHLSDRRAIACLEARSVDVWRV
jgi:hypothetical protein